MSVKASLLRRAALTLVAGVAISLPMGAKADLLHGLSIRAGAFFPTSGALRDVTDVAAFGGGLLIGLKISKSLYWEAKYEWIDRHGLGFSADGFRTYVGWRF